MIVLLRLNGLKKKKKRERSIAGSVFLVNCSAERLLPTLVLGQIESFCCTVVFLSTLMHWGDVCCNADRTGSLQRCVTGNQKKHHCRFKRRADVKLVGEKKKQKTQQLNVH